MNFSVVTTRKQIQEKAKMRMKTLKVPKKDRKVFEFGYQFGFNAGQLCMIQELRKGI